MAKPAQTDPVFYSLVQDELAQMTPMQLTRFRTELARGLPVFLREVASKARSGPQEPPGAMGQPAGIAFSGDKT